jgi:hypothetical protein
MRLLLMLPQPVCVHSAVDLLKDVAHTLLGCSLHVEKITTGCLLCTDGNYTCVPLLLPLLLLQDGLGSCALLEAAKGGHADVIR